MGLQSHYTSANTGGIKRGDGEETGDLAAQPTETADRTGSGASGGNSGASGHVTADSSALGVSRGETLLQGESNLEDLTVMDATDPDLGLTNVEGKPAEDWAADTGASTSTEASAPSHKR